MPMNLRKDGVTSSSVSVTWDSLGEDLYDGLTITLVDPYDVETSLSLDKAVTRHTFSDLLPAEPYTVKLMSRLIDIKSDQAYVNIYTSQLQTA